MPNLRHAVSLIAALIVLSLWCLGSAWAQTASGTHVGAVNASPTDAEYLLNGPDARLPNAHPVTVTSPITKNSPAPGGNFTLGLDTVPIGTGGTGQTTRQAAINALMDAAGATSQDIFYFNGTNWTRFAKGANGTFLGVDGSGNLHWTTASVGAIASSAEVLVLSTDASAPNGRVFTLTTGLTATDLGAGSTYTLGVDSTVLTTTSTQTGITNKTFTLPSFAYNAASGIILKGASFDSRLKWADWAAARNITIPDPGADADVVVSEGNATINGTKTFSDLKLSGTTFKTASNTITVPAADDTLVNLGSTQTISTGKTIQMPVFTASSSRFWRASQSGFFTNFKVDPPAADRDITFPEVANNSKVALQSTSTTHVAGGILYDTDSNGLGAVTSAGSAEQPLLGGITPAFGTLPAAGGGTGVTTVPAKGSILVGNAGGTAYANLGVGSNGQSLVADSASTNGVKWATAGGVTSIGIALSGLSNLFTVSGSPVTSSGDITLTGSATTGDLPYASGSNTWNKLGIGSTGQYLKVAGGVPTWAAGDGAGFGGTGADGAVTKGAVTETTVMQYSATTFTQSSSTTYAPKSGSTYLSTSTQDWNGTTNVAAGYPGGKGGQTYQGAIPGPSGGHGPCGGMGGYFTYGTDVGGGGGGNGGAGGNGAGTACYGAGGGASPFVRGAGSSGSGAGGNGATGGDGGAGGGLISCCAVGALTVGSGASINANGTAGSVTNSRGGGGGAGGTIYLASQTSITMTGSCSATGGNGGNGSSAYGGGGGGGYIVRHSPSNTGAGSLTVTKGTKGGGSAVDGADGSSISITGYPNVPLMGYMFHDGGLDELKMIATMHRITTGDTNYDITGNEYASIASHGNVFDMAMYLGDDRMTATEGECPVLGIFDYCEVWADAS